MEGIKEQKINNVHQVIMKWFRGQKMIFTQ
jgi:hypothetical protein